QELLFVKKNYMPARVTWSRNDNDIVSEQNFCFTFQHLFSTKPARAVVGVHHSFTAKLFVEQSMIGDIVAMRQQHLTDAAHCLDAFHELGSETRRIDQNVSAFTC